MFVRVCLLFRVCVYHVYSLYNMPHLTVHVSVACVTVTVTRIFTVYVMCQNILTLIHQSVIID